MKIFSAWVATLACVLGLAFLNTQGAFAAQTLFQITNNVNTAIGTFDTFLADQKLSDEEYFSQYEVQAAKLETVLDQAATDITALNDTSAANSSLVQAIRDMKSDITASRLAVQSGDEDKYRSALQDFDTATVAYNSAIDKLNENTTGLTGDQGMTLYGALAAVAAVTTAGSFTWAFSKRLHDLPELKEARRKVAIASLWPLGGALVTLATFIWTTDGVYFIAWGPILVGGAFFVKAAFDYRAFRQAHVAAGNLPVTSSVSGAAMQPSAVHHMPTVPTATTGHTQPAPHDHNAPTHHTQQ